MMRALKPIVFAALTAFVLIGCGKSDKAVERKPVGFSEHDRCHICGMAILRYKGPKAEIFMKNIDEPIKFCSTRDGFTFALQPENKKRVEAIFLHDIGRTDWDKPEDSALINAKDAFYVYGSDKEGVMGIEAIPFSSEQSAKTFEKEHGGGIYKYPDITLELLAK